MEIIVDHQLAVLKKGTAFDFVSENRYFSGADSYSMAITFPLLHDLVRRDLREALAEELDGAGA